jgi:hypothetical protein
MSRKKYEKLNMRNTKVFGNKGKVRKNCRDFFLETVCRPFLIRDADEPTTPLVRIGASSLR